MARVTDDDERLVREHIYKFGVEALRETTKVQAEYGRWLIATVTAVQLGAIYFVGGIPNVSMAAKAPAIWVFVAGLLLILLAGLAAWTNWGLIANVYQRWTNANMLVDTEIFPRNESNRWISVTFWGAIILGLASAACIPIGAAVLNANLPAVAGLPSASSAPG